MNDVAGVLGQQKVRTYQDIVCNWSMAKMTLLGVRAITMQQPFASAMVAGKVYIHNVVVQLPSRAVTRVSGSLSIAVETMST